MDERVTFEEFPVFLPAGEEWLCAVVCVPNRAVRSPGVVLLTGGNYTRSHRNRTWVRAARALAVRGFASIRLDYHGVGDSTGSATIDLENPFDEDAVAASDFLRRATGVGGVMMAATCFGGRTALAAAARDSSVVAAVLFPVPVVMPRHRGPAPPRQRIRQRLKNLKPVRSLLRHPQIHRMRRSKARQRRTARFVTSPRMRRDLKEVLSRIDVRFVYGERTASLGEFHRLVAELEPELTPDRRARFKLEIIPGAEVAGLHTLADQELAIAKVVEAVEQVSAARSAQGALAPDAPVPR